MPTKPPIGWDADRALPILAALVPGWPDARQGRPIAAWIAAGSAGAGLLGCALLWGTWFAWVLLAIGWYAHIRSVSRAVRIRTFPHRGEWAAWIWSIAVVGGGIYGPALLLATNIAGVTSPIGQPPSRFLINRFAYGAVPPRQGEWVLVRCGGGRPPAVGRVLALAGQTLRSLDGVLFVDGFLVARSRSTRAQRSQFVMVVPANHYLVEEGGSGAEAATFRTVPRTDVLGRAWARILPVWERCLLE